MKERIFLSPPHMSGQEQNFINEAFESNFIAPLGPQVDAFEKEFSEYVGIKYCLALSSGTSAIHLALKNLNIQPGDEVFASSLTFIGSVSPITFEGATPVFIDCDLMTWNMDPDLLEEELKRCAENNKLPKAVIPTDLYGQCCDLPRIKTICDQYDIPVICDSAESLGAKLSADYADSRRLNNRQPNNDTNQTNQINQINQTNQINEYHAGKGAKAAIFSFNGNKIITTSGGGMLASDDKEFIDRARFLSQQAREPFPHYEHTEIGFNYRMSNIVAAIGRGQLRVLDDRVQKKREIFDYYKKYLGDVSSGITFMPEALYNRCTRWLTVMLVDPEKFGASNEDIRLTLEAENIESRPVWKPMHMQPVFSTSGPNANNGKKQYNARVVRGKVSEHFFCQGLCLPSGTAMTQADQDRIISIILNCQK